MLGAVIGGYPKWRVKIAVTIDERSVNMRTVKIEWEGPFTSDEVLELGDPNRDFGLYQIYGRHVIFGDNSLLYIGEVATKGRTFSQRFVEHTEWLKEEEGVFIRVGRINKKDYDEADRQQVLKDTEALTIYWHSPPYNSDNIDNYNGQPLKVINDGKRGDLCERLSAGDKMTFLLQVFEKEKEMALDSSCAVQSEVFEITGNTKDRILQKARKKALNNVLREDLKDLFEKQRWKTGKMLGRFYTLREYEKGKYQALLLITDPSNDATTIFYQLSQPSQRRSV